MQKCAVLSDVSNGMRVSKREREKRLNKESNAIKWNVLAYTNSLNVYTQKACRNSGDGGDASGRDAAFFIPFIHLIPSIRTILQSQLCQ